MSAKYMGLVWEKFLPFNKAFVLLAMADHADHEGKNVFPSLGLVAWKTGYSIQSVKRIVADLRDDGILVRDDETPGGVVIYRIELEHIPDKPKRPKTKSGRPQGKSVLGPRGEYEKHPPPIEKTPSYIETGFDKTHNHQNPFNEVGGGSVGLGGRPSSECLNREEHLFDSLKPEGDES